MIEGQETDRDRFHAWYDQLHGPERGEVDYITRELKGDFATAYLLVEMRRMGGQLAERMYALENRSPFRVGLRELVGVGGAVLAMLGWRMHGGDPPNPLP